MTDHQLRCASPSPENAWHLYDDDLNLRSIPHRAIRHQNRRLAAVIRPKIGG